MYVDNGTEKTCNRETQATSALLLFLAHSSFPSSFFFFFNFFFPFGAYSHACTPKAANYDDFGSYAHRPPAPLPVHFCHSVAARSYRELLSFGTRSLNLVNDNRARPGPAINLPACPPFPRIIIIHP